MERIEGCLEDNKFKVNLDNNLYSIFQTKNMIILHWLNNIKANNNIIRHVQSARFSGIELDEKLKSDDDQNL